jgi:hypothetical protein
MLATFPIISFVGHSGLGEAGSAYALFLGIGALLVFTVSYSALKRMVAS